MTLTFENLGLNYIDIIILVAVVIGSYFFTVFLFSKYINYAKAKGWTGKDIHKNSRPEVAESGGIPFILGLIPAFIIIIVVFPKIRAQTIVFMVTVFFSAFVGFIDDRTALSSIKKIILMLITGVPIFLMNLLGYIHITSPIIPVIGQTQLTIIYPIAIPLIIAVLTNATNMLEGYNGEGSGSTLIVFCFMIIYSIISHAALGLIFSLVILGSLVAFVKFNKFPAKVFPGDVGTLALGAAIACVGIFGSIEAAMFCAILVYIFNGFYVLASLRGFKERHTIQSTDIIVRDDDVIEAATGENVHLTLPRLVLATKPLTEYQLVKNIWALTVIGGLFGVVAEVANVWTLDTTNYLWPLISVIIIAPIFTIILIKYNSIRGISLFMIVILLGILGILIVTDIFIVPTVLNWLFAGILAAVGLFIWYYLSIKYFNYKISKAKAKEKEKQE